MKLNHLNLTVTDPIAAQDFFVKYFGLKAMRKGNKNMALLSDDSETEISLMSPKMGNETEFSYPATFHIGFIQESEDEVNRINATLKADGFEVPEPVKTHGSWTFYFDAPFGVTIEVMA